jgi:hypothetical protein
VRELGRWSRGTAWLTATFPLVFDLPETLASSGGGLCIGFEVERVGRREGVECRVNGRQEAFPESSQVYKRTWCARSRVNFGGCDWVSWVASGGGVLVRVQGYR